VVGSHGRRPETTTVAIAGAGPAGLVLAHLLKRDGIPFIVIEKRARPELCRRPKAGLVEYRTVQLLRRVGIAGPILEFAHENHRCEFRTPNGSAVVDYGALTGGRPHYVYPQHQLVQRLCDTLVGSGGQVWFGHTVRSVRPQPGQVELGVTGPDGGESVIRCDVVVGCEGSQSAVAAAMTGTRVTEQVLPARWLAAIGAVPPIAGHTIYAAHPRGFAGQMRRTPSQTRFYLEIPVTDTTADWPEDRVRDELSARLGEAGHLHGVSFGDMSVLDLRMRVVEPMQEGRLLLAGDAAHLITPAGAKGMNLAIQDAVELAGGLAERFGAAQDPARLAAYSRRRLPAIWRTQAFSAWFLHIILASLQDGGPAPTAAPGGFGHRLSEGWVNGLQEEPLFARWFAHAYAGVDPDSGEAGLVSEVSR
jgi:p-hydroxybenzoate 3-monooxygenase